MPVHHRQPVPRRLVRQVPPPQHVVRRLTVQRSLRIEPRMDEGIAAIDHEQLGPPQEPDVIRRHHPGDQVPQVRIRIHDERLAGAVVIGVEGLHPAEFEPAARHRLAVDQIQHFLLVIAPQEDEAPPLLAVGQRRQPGQHATGVRAPVDIVPQQDRGEGLARVPGLLPDAEQGRQRRLQQVEAPMDIPHGANDRTRRHLGSCHVGGVCHAGDV